MFTLDDINAARKRAVDEKWSFPYLFNSLKALGIERYEVNVLTGEFKYVGQGATLVAPPAEGTVPKEAGAYDAAGVKTALMRSQAKETTFEEFLTEVAAAGVTFYRVDMKPRTVTYHGAGKRDKLVEPVPDTKTA